MIALYILDTRIGEVDVVTAFETLVRGGPLDLKAAWCPSWEQAEELHKALCAAVEQAAPGGTA